MKKRFTKTVEDFICGHCGREVEGNGYTNHCPFCLWSKHVDINPGDREATCGGLMKPIRLEKEKSEYIVTHECIVCGYTKRNKLSIADDFDVAIEATQVKA
jgi:rubrerythrin